MAEIDSRELVLIRHAPADHGGRLCGRTDVAACLPEGDTLAPLRDMISGLEVVASPALRCRQTAEALFPETVFSTDARLWEQDFGDQDGVLFEDLPNLGALTLAELADHSAPNGESFAQMVARVRPALEGLAARIEAGSGPIVVVAHAGTARAALAMAMGQAAPALAFEIAPLSVTRLRCHAAGLSVVAVNERWLG